MPVLSTYPKQKIAITFPITQLKRAKEKAKKELSAEEKYEKASEIRDEIQQLEESLRPGGGPTTKD